MPAAQPGDSVVVCISARRHGAISAP